jgi:zinc D-Ala-D-Ala carboxypeptidase
MADEVMLSEHFALSEFVHSDTATAQGIDNTPTTEVMLGLEQLAPVMEKVRNILGGHPITITSGYRCPQLNAAIGGVPDSAHLSGLACDFVVPVCGTPLSVCQMLEPHMAELGIDQLIMETDWVHLGLSAAPEPPRCEALTLTAGGGYTTGFA